MKYVAAGILVIAVLACAGGAALASGLLALPNAELQTSVQGLPPLQPLVTQAASDSDMIVTLSERFLNEQMAQNFAADGQVTDARIDLLQNSQAVFSARVKTGILNIQPKATVLLSVRNGRIVLDVQKVDVGGFGIPNSMIEPQIQQLKETAETELNRQFVELQRTTGLTLQSLATTDNSITLFFGQ